MSTRGKVKTRSATDASEFSREDIEAIIRSSVEQTAAAVRTELTDLLNARLDAIYKELKGKNDIILALEKREQGTPNDKTQRVSRKDNILIQGLPATYSESLSVQSDEDASTNDITPVETFATSETVFVEFCQKLRIDVSGRISPHAIDFPVPAKQSIHLFLLNSQTAKSGPLC